MRSLPTPQELSAFLHEMISGRIPDNEIHEILGFCVLLHGIKSFVDCGANLGAYTWTADLVLEGASIFAIEANPELCEGIRRQAAGNQNRSSAGSNNTISVIDAAVSDKPGTLSFGIDMGNPLNSAVCGVESDGGKNPDIKITEVRAIQLDALFPDSSPDLVKIDIEGAEWRALLGCEAIMKQRKTRFYVEIHPWGDAEYNVLPSDVFKLMRSREYVVRRVGRHWLFTPGKCGLVERLKSAFYGWILNHPKLRTAARKLVYGKG